MQNIEYVKKCWQLPLAHYVDSTR